MTQILEAKWREFEESNPYKQGENGEEEEEIMGDSSPGEEEEEDAPSKAPSSEGTTQGWLVDERWTCSCAAGLCGILYVICFRRGLEAIFIFTSPTCPSYFYTEVH